MPFELEDSTPAMLASINVRSEKHGPDHLEPAVDLAFQIRAKCLSAKVCQLIVPTRIPKDGPRLRFDLPLVELLTVGKKQI